MAFQRRRSIVDMTIKPFKVQPKLPENFESSTWTSLETFIDAIFDKTSTQLLCRLDLYNGVEELVLQHQSHHLLVKLVEKCNRHILQKFSSLTSDDLNSSSFLWTFLSIWENYYTSLHSIRQVFLPLDRLYIINTEEQSLLNVGYSLFRERFCEFPPLKEKTFKWFINILTERRNQIFQSSSSNEISSLLKSITKMLLTLKLYKEEFEGSLFSASDLYFQLEGQMKVKSLSISSYLAHVEQRLIEEENAISTYLDEQSRPVLMDSIRRMLIENSLGYILNKNEIMLFLQDLKIVDFRRLYLLLSQIDRLDDLKASFLECVETIGHTILNPLSFEEYENSSILPKLFELKRKTDCIWSQSFNENKQFFIGLKERWELFLNADVTIIKSMSLLLAKFCDSLLRTRKEHAKSKAKFMDQLTQMMFIFRYLQGKDYFVEYYRSELYNRLLSKKPIHEVYEQAILEKLKEECGNDFTSTIEEIFKDAKESEKTASAFHKDREVSAAIVASGVTFEVRLFAKNVWTHLTEFPPIQFPPIGETLQQLFLSFYQRQKMYEKRVLMWYPHLGSAILQATFQRKNSSLMPFTMDTMTRCPSRTFELNVSQLQAICLLQFNEAEEFSFKELRNKTSIEDDELYRQLLGLTLHQKGSILCCSEEQENREKILFRVNSEFYPKASRLSFYPLQSKEAKINTAEAEKRVEESRLHGMDAAIVRMMKSNRFLKHTELLSLFLPLLPFRPKMADINQCIDSLISRNYIEKNDGDVDNPTYSYVL
ncbi:cullin family protein [Cardiosporidium cionae]|uniref:Cullin family protein n=1 Tax=Cardiosporidium cionae TaxID=476202 RepID=A0ABQ7JFD9_9APIC|nr:cullin family protein [Cardiosporidium cionae]|eukprot:KAF8822702.1 cullin family protein [Cardiosporidium cionae]